MFASWTPVVIPCIAFLNLHICFQSINYSIFMNLTPPTSFNGHKVTYEWNKTYTKLKVNRFYFTTLSFCITQWHGYSITYLTSVSFNDKWLTHTKSNLLFRTTYTTIHQRLQLQEEWSKGQKHKLYLSFSQILTQLYIYKTWQHYTLQSNHKQQCNIKKTLCTSIQYRSISWEHIINI